MKLIELYQEENDSTVYHNGSLYSVNKLLEIAELKETEDVPVSDLEWLLDAVDADEDTERIAAADLTIPVIIAKYEDRWLVLDGFHRLQKAVAEGVETLPAKKFNTRELKKCLVK